MTVVIGLIENQTAEHITFISSWTTHHLYPNNFHGPLKCAYQNYYPQKIIYKKRHHIMMNVSPPVDITKSELGNNKQKIMKTLRKTANVILYGLTHPTANR